MTKKALIMYFTLTGNTTKVVNRFQEVFKKRDWECDVLKVDTKTNVTQSPSPFDISKYDFFCFIQETSGCLRSYRFQRVLRRR